MGAHVIERDGAKFLRRDVKVVDVMAKLVQDNGYDYVLFGGGLLGFEIGAGLTARLGAGVTMEVTAVKVDGGKLVVERPILQGLTEREHEVLALMASGRNNAAIARDLVLSERAVEKHINSIFRKLGLSEQMEVNQRVAAVLFFLQRNE